MIEFLKDRKTKLIHILQIAVKEHSIHVGAGEMAQRLRALAAALPEVLRSNPSNHMVAHNHL